MGSTAEVKEVIRYIQGHERQKQKKLADRIAWEDSPFDFSEGVAESAANGKE